LNRSQLLGVGHREPVFAQQDAVLEEHLLEDRASAAKTAHILRRTEPHDLLDAGAVVPGPIEEHDFTL
jgi:phosphoribosyl-dephospho-CoA transferase